MRAEMCVSWFGWGCFSSGGRRIGSLESARRLEVRGRASFGGALVPGSDGLGLERRVDVATAVVMGGAGFLGSHLCDYLVGEGFRVICVDNLGDGVVAERGAPARRRLRLRAPRHHRPPRGRRAGRLRLPPGEPGQPDRLSTPAACRRSRSARTEPTTRSAWPSGSARVSCSRRRARCTAIRRAPAAGDLLGQRQPDRPARGVRRGEALRRGVDDGLPPPAGRRHAHRPHLQHLRHAHATARRPRHSDLRPPGAGGRAADRVRRRLADAQLLLCRRPCSRSRAARRAAASTCR